MISCYICEMLCGYIVIFAGFANVIVLFAGFANVVTLIAGIAIGCLILVLLWCTPSCPPKREGKH